MAEPGPPPPVTCEDSDADLMVVVGEDHSLGRHVSQRSHRTDRSREKPEPGARRPGARLPRRARGGRASERASGKEGAERPVAWRGGGGNWTGGGGERPRQECAGSRRGRSRAARPRVRRGRREPGAGEAAASLTGPAEAAGPGRASPEKALRSETQARRRDGKKRPRGTGSTRSGGCGGGLGDRGGATPRGVQLVESEGRSESERASQRGELGYGVPGAGRSRAQPEWDRARLLGARVARDWLGGRGAGTREARTQPSRRASDRSNPPPSLQPRRTGPLAGEPLCTRCGRTVGSASWKARVKLEVAAGAAWVAERWLLGRVSPVGGGG